MVARTPAVFQALPPYLGGKRRLAPIIFAMLAEIVPPARWPGLGFVDPFCGGGAVALYAKLQGFNVTAADIAERACIVARAVIANSRTRLTFEDVLDLYVEPGSPYPKAARAYVPSVFSDTQASWLDRALERAGGRREPVRSLLMLVIVKAVLRLHPMSVVSATDARAALTGDFDRVSPHRLAHFARADAQLKPKRVWQLAQDVNSGVVGGTGVASKGDALRTLTTTDASVAYIDPPYAGTASYASAYRALDEILGDRRLDARPPGLADIVAAAAHIPTIVVSYGGPSTSLQELTLLVGRFRTVRRAIAIPYPHLASIATEEKNASNEEFIVIAST